MTDSDLCIAQRDFNQNATRLVDNAEYFLQRGVIPSDNEGDVSLLFVELKAPHTKPIRIYVGIEYTSELQKEILPGSNDKEYYFDIELPDKADYITYWASDYGGSLKAALKQLCIDHDLASFYESTFGKNEQR